MRRKLKFSPIVATLFAISSSTDFPDWLLATFRESILSKPTANSATFLTKFWKISFLDTKSVSEFISIAAPCVPFTQTAVKPSAATLPAFFAAAARPLVLSQSTADSKSPFVSNSAFLQSIMPAPVFSLKSLTSDADIDIT